MHCVNLNVREMNQNLFDQKSVFTFYVGLILSTCECHGRYLTEFSFDSFIRSTDRQLTDNTLIHDVISVVLCTPPNVQNHHSGMLSFVVNQHVELVGASNSMFAALHIQLFILLCLPCFHGVYYSTVVCTRNISSGQLLTSALFS